MRNVHKEKKAPKTYKYEIDHNPYELLSYNSKSELGKVIVFPIVHYEGDKQYIDLINPLLEKGYHVLTIKFINKGDYVLFFNYYGKVFSQLLTNAIENKIIHKEEIILMGFGVGALLCTYLQNIFSKVISKMILISPLNKYKDEYMISKNIENYNIPTYIFFGQYDKVINIDSRYMMFEKGHLNPKVTFITYPITGHYLYYKDKLSISLEENYRKNDYDLILGENSKYKSSYLPEEIEYNERFFVHLFTILENKPLPKRIGLLTDVFPLFTNGVSTVVNLLKKQFDEMGYETYIIALWDKKESINSLPDEYIPVLGSSAHFVKGYKDLHLLKSFAFQRQAKMLTTFGFDYLHLHTEYSMSQIALWLAKYTGIKMVYTYHTLWKLYYEHHFGKLIGDITYSAARDLLFRSVYKECPVITVPSLKSYEVLKEESNAKDIRIIPSSINFDLFKMNKDDYKEVEKLKKKYNLIGKKVLGYVGRVSMEKNIFETLEYITKVKSEIPNIVFIIVGVGNALKPLKKEIKNLGLEEQVIFTGVIDNDKLKYYYSLFDVFVTASNFETQGLTYFEAATNGTLILAKEDKAIEGIFKDGENAYLYKDFYGWVSRLEKALFSNNTKIINNAKNEMKKFAPERWAKRILAIYQELNPKKK